MAVTGANKGIGYEVARRLLSDHPDATVLVTSRNEVRRKRRAVGRTPGGAPLFPSLSPFFGSVPAGPPARVSHTLRPHVASPLPRLLSSPGASCPCVPAAPGLPIPSLLATALF